MGFFSFVKKIGKRIKHGVKKIGKTIRSGSGYLGKGLNFVKKVAGKVRKIPVIGDIAEDLARQPIFKGKSAVDLFNKLDRGHKGVEKGIAAADKLASGNVKGAYKDAMSARAHFH